MRGRGEVEPGGRARPAEPGQVDGCPRGPGAEQGREVGPVLRRAAEAVDVDGPAPVGAGRLADVQGHPARGDLPARPGPAVTGRAAGTWRDRRARRRWPRRADRRCAERRRAGCPAPGAQDLRSSARGRSTRGRSDAGTTMAPSITHPAPVGTSAGTIRHRCRRESAPLRRESAPLRPRVAHRGRQRVGHASDIRRANCDSRVPSVPTRRASTADSRLCLVRSAGRRGWDRRAADGRRRHLGRAGLVDLSRARCPRREEARMRTAARSAGYGALLVAAFTAAWTAGVIVRPAPAPLTPGAATPPAAATPAPTATPGPAGTSRPRRSRRRPRRGSPRWTATRSGSTGTWRSGTPAQVFVTVSRDGAGVTDLEPLDGAFGRLVGLRAGDLAPAHVHPDATPPAPTDRAGPGIAFTAEVPGGGTYRLILDFRHAGAVHTAVFTPARRLTDDARKAGDDQHAHTGPRRRHRSRRRAGTPPPHGRATRRPGARSSRWPSSPSPSRTRNTRCGPRRRSPWPR